MKSYGLRDDQFERIGMTGASDWPLDALGEHYNPGDLAAQALVAWQLSIART